jgi:hypothetical protein
MKPDIKGAEPPTCQYRGYRNPPGHQKEYDLSPQYWHVFAARLAFVVVFEVMSNARSASQFIVLLIIFLNSFSFSLKKCKYKQLNCSFSRIFKSAVFLTVK